MTLMKALYEKFFTSGSAAESQGKLIDFDADYCGELSNKRFPIVTDNAHEYSLVISLLEDTGVRWQGGQALKEYNPFSISHNISDLRDTNFEGDFKKLILMIHGDGKMTYVVEFVDSFISEFSHSDFFDEEYSACTVAEFKKIYQEDIGPSFLLSPKKHVNLTNPSFLVRKDE